MHQPHFNERYAKMTLTVLFLAFICSGKSLFNEAGVGIASLNSKYSLEIDHKKIGDKPQLTLSPSLYDRLGMAVANGLFSAAILRLEMPFWEHVFIINGFLGPEIGYRKPGKNSGLLFSISPGFSFWAYPFKKQWNTAYGRIGAGFCASVGMPFACKFGWEMTAGYIYQRHAEDFMAIIRSPNTMQEEPVILKILETYNTFYLSWNLRYAIF
jgi:hypothetical protein